MNAFSFKAISQNIVIILRSNFTSVWKNICF